MVLAGVPYRWYPPGIRGLSARTEIYLYKDPGRPHIPSEMQDDPLWSHKAAATVIGGGRFDFDSYFIYQRQWGTYATTFNLSAFVEMTGIGVQV